MGSEGSGLSSQAAVALPIACGTPGGRVPKGARRFGQDKGGVGRKWKGNSTVWLGHGGGEVPRFLAGREYQGRFQKVFAERGD